MAAIIIKSLESDAFFFSLQEKTLEWIWFSESLFVVFNFIFFKSYHKELWGTESNVDKKPQTKTYGIEN